MRDGLAVLARGTKTSLGQLAEVSEAERTMEGKQNLAASDARGLLQYDVADSFVAQVVDKPPHDQIID